MKRKRTVCCVIAVILALLLGTATIMIALSSNSRIPQIRIQSRKADCKGLTLEELADFIKAEWLDNISFSAEEAETEVKGHAVVPTFINESYFDLQRLSLVGESFTEDDISDRSRKIIISDTLALKLFLNSNAVGNFLYIDGEKYLVCGVYIEPKDIIGKCSLDGKDRVFLPYTLAKSNKLAVNTVLYENYSKNAIINQLCTGDYKMTNLVQKAKVLNDFVNLTKLTAFFILSVTIIKLVVSLSKQLYIRIKQELPEKYFSEIVKDNYRYILTRLIAIIALTAIPITTYIIADFRIYIPPSYIPPDNIFDVSYYISKIVEASQQFNAVKTADSGYYQQLYSITFNVSFYVFSLFLIMSMVSYFKVSRAVKEFTEQKSKTKSVM